MAYQLFLAWVVPGYKQEGLPVPSLGYKTLMYNCNALWSIYITYLTAFVLHYTGVFRLTEIIDNYGHLMTVAMIWGFAVSFGTYFWAVFTGNAIRMSGNFAYDVFMGAALNPRLGPVDLKMWAEVRIPWVIVFFLSVSGACKQYETYGAVTPVSSREATAFTDSDESCRTWLSCASPRGSTSTPGKICPFGFQ
jgi:delta24(24(1))-sterol reductase